MNERVDVDVWETTRPALRVRARANWLYARAVFHRFRLRFLILLVVLAGGGALFSALSPPEQEVTFFRGLYYTWCLIFFEPQVAFPDNLVLDVIFFIVPLMGLMILVETFLELSIMLRDRRHNEREWSRMIASEMSNHVVLVGCGRLGLRTLGHLLKMRMPVVVIESDEKNAFLAQVRAQRIPVLVGNGRDDRMLADANVAKAKSVICCTNDDLANLEIALDARRLNPGIRVVLRLFDQNLANKIRDGFNIHVAFSTAAMAAPSFAAAATDPSIKTSFMVDGQLVVVSRIQVQAGAELANRSIADLCGGLPMHVVAHQPAGAAESRTFPPPDTILRPKDQLLVQLRFEDLSRLREMNKARGRAPEPASAT
ncbi:MAG: hypothetical protein BroJett003_16530 [Planctomycetota bacterium]|nr:MAG: hypothetical protein BroJett003_16530 [Planctomycetota bacterium]